MTEAFHEGLGRCHHALRLGICHGLSGGCLLGGFAALPQNGCTDDPALVRQHHAVRLGPANRLACTAALQPRRSEGCRGSWLGLLAFHRAAARDRTPGKPSAAGFIWILDSPSVSQDSAAL